MTSAWTCGLCSLLLVACSKNPDAVGSHRHTGSSGSAIGNSAAAFGGSVLVAGQAPVRADVAVVDEAGAVVGSAPVVGGRYQVVDALAGKPAAVVVRFEEPVIGVRRIAVADGAAPDVIVGAAELVAIDATIAVPAGARFDWAELRITPVDDAIAPTVTLRSDADPRALRGAMVTRKLDRPAASLAVLRGSYRVVVDRIADVPLKSAEARDNLTLGALAAGGQDVAIAPTGAVIAIAGPTALAVTLRRLQPGEQ